MSRFFVDDPPVPIADPDGSANVIYIRARMDMATDAKVKNDLVRLGADNQTVETAVGNNQLALLTHNIVSWSGPDFDGVPCDAAHIRQLPAADPLIEAVLNAIGERNRRPKAGSASVSAGARESSAPVSRGRRAQPAIEINRSENGTYTSSLPAGSDGRPIRSDD